MGDVLSPGGDFLAWAACSPRIIATGRTRAYQKLISNLRATPLIEPTPGPQQIFFAESCEEHGRKIWQFDVAPQDRSANWAHIFTIYNLVKTLQAQAGIITAIPIAPPPPNGINLHRVMLRLLWVKGITVRPLAL